MLHALPVHVLERQGAERGPFPGWLAPDPRTLLVACGAGGAIEARPLAEVRIDVLAWRLSTETARTELVATDRAAIAGKVRKLHGAIESLKRGGKGRQGFAATRERCLSVLREIAPLLGDEELALELWETADDATKVRV